MWHNNAWQLLIKCKIQRLQWTIFIIILFDLGFKQQIKHENTKTSTTLLQI